MIKFQQNLSNFKRGDFSHISRKIVLNEIIKNKNFSEFYLRNVKFFNCNFQNVGFGASRGHSLTFCNCQFNNVNFSKAEFIDIIFQNCQLVNCGFGSAELDSVRYVNCQLNNLRFNATQLSDFEFEKSHLLDVSFGGSEVDNLIIKNSRLRNIDFNQMTVLKTVSKNDILIIERVPIRNYANFLTEFVRTEQLIGAETINFLNYSDLTNRSFQILKAVSLIFISLLVIPY